MEKVRLGNDFILKLVLYKVDDQLVLDNDGNPISGTPEDLTTAKNLTLKLYNLKYRKEYNLIKSVNINTIQTEILSNIQQIGQHYVLLEYDQSNEQFDSGYQHFKVGLYSFEILSQTSNIEIIDQIILCSCVNSGSGPGQIDLSNYVKNTDLNQTLLAYAKSEDLSLKVDKINGKQLSDNNYTTADKNKLSGISDNANLYIHPENHPPSIITQDSNNRFVSDNEKSIWNNKQNTIGFIPEDIANKNIANGYAGLDGNGKILSSNLPEASSPVISVSGKTGIVNLDKNDVGLNNVDNTSLSTWNGSSNINQVGTIQTGVWEGEIISLEKGGTGLNTIGQPNQILKVNSLGDGLEYSDVSEGSSGTVTSVNFSAPIGFSISGAPITGSGIIALNYADGYSLPTILKQQNWDTAYGWGNHEGLYKPISYIPNWNDVQLKPTTLEGYGITDAQHVNDNLTSISVLTEGFGFLRKNELNTWVFDTNSYLTSNQTISINGDATGSGSTSIDIVLNTVPINKGGTGLSEIGLANQLLKVNSNATGLEYFTPEFNNGSGTVTSISMSTPVGLIVSGSPITTSGTFSISFAEGYSIPAIIKQNNWDDAYSWGDHNGLYEQTIIKSAGYAKYNGSSWVFIDEEYSLVNHNHNDLYQQINSNLTAIAGLPGTSGFLKKTAEGTWNLDTSTYLKANQSITLSGAVTGSGSTSIVTTYSGVVPTNKGGTGLTSIGTAGQYLSVNSSGTGLEWITSREKSVNTVTTLASLPITKRLVIATVSAATTLSLAAALEVGDELHIIVYNNSGSAITQTLPNTGSFISLSGTSISIPAGGRIEINILCYATTSYLIRAL